MFKFSPKINWNQFRKIDAFPFYIKQNFVSDEVVFHKHNSVLERDNVAIKCKQQNKTVK